LTEEELNAVVNASMAPTGQGEEMQGEEMRGSGQGVYVGGARPISEIR
jgi:hypothetical protein